MVDLPSCCSIIPTSSFESRLRDLPVRFVRFRFRLATLRAQQRLLNALSDALNLGPLLMERLQYHFAQEGTPLRLPLILYKLWASDVRQSITSTIGTALILFVLYRAVVFAWTFIRPSKLQIYCHSETGSWALVTGGSDGIGLAFGEELSSRGFNVLLHGRNQEKLDRVKVELSKKYPSRSVEVVVADASLPNDSYSVVAEKVKRLPGKLTILVNNIGGNATYPQHHRHDDIPHEHIDITSTLTAASRHT